MIGKIYSKYKILIWIITVLAALIGLASGMVSGFIFMTIFGLIVSYIIATPIYYLTEPKAEKEKRLARKHELRNLREQKRLEEQRQKEIEAQKEQDLQRQREEARQKQIRTWQTEDLSQYAAKISDLKLKKNEYSYFISDESITWSEERVHTRRINYGGLTGSIHIAKGLNYRLGSVRTDIQRDKVLEPVFSGILVLTNKRIIVTNGEQAKTYMFTRLLKLKPYTDGVALISNAGKKVVLSGFKDAMRFNIYLDRLTSD